MRSKLLAIALLLATALLFFISNRGAYKNYFEADSLDNLALAHAVGWDTILKPLVIPTVPVDNFATFYVTGWTGQGSGFNNPCQGNGDDPVPNNDAGYIVGHFIKYVDALNTGGGGPSLCDFTAFGNCVAVLTR